MTARQKRFILWTVIWLLRGAAIGVAFVAVANAYASIGLANERVRFSESVMLLIASVLVWSGSVWLQQRRLAVRLSVFATAAAATASVLILLLVGDRGALDDACTHSTVDNIVSVATAIDAYVEDHHEYPAARNLDELARTLEPRYISKLPRDDGWGFPLRYASAGNDILIGSAGKFGKWEREKLASYTRRQNNTPEQDMVYSVRSGWVCVPR